MSAGLTFLRIKSSVGSSFRVINPSFSIFLAALRCAHLHLVLLAHLTPALVSCPRKSIPYGPVLACGDGERVQLPR